MEEKKGQKIPSEPSPKLSKAVSSGNPVIDDSLLPHFVELRNLVYESFNAQAVYAAAKVGIADLLEDGPKSADYLADATGNNPDALYRLLRALASEGIFRETSARVFELTPMAELLQENHPMSLRSFLLLIGDPTFREPWGNILYSIKTGEPAFDYIFKKGLFAYLEEHEDAMELFQRYMTVSSIVDCPVISSSYPFSKFRKVIDIGGGRGPLLVHILRKHPSVNGVLFDLPDVVQGANAIDSDIAPRCEIVSGDFFKGVPEGGDLYILQQVIHDWNDELATHILANCRKAMADNGRLLVIDAVLVPGNSRDANKFVDLAMLVGHKGGRERTEPEFRKIFQDAGLELTRIIPTDSIFSLSIIEGKKS